MNEESVVKLRNKLSNIISKYHLKKVILFGSRARGDNKDNSDYDFFIDAPELTSLLKFGTLSEDMKNVLHSEVDIVLFPDEYTTIKPYLLDQIRKDGITVYE